MSRKHSTFILSIFSHHIQKGRISLDYGKAIKLKPFSIAFDKVSLNLLNLITLDKRTNKKRALKKFIKTRFF